MKIYSVRVDAVHSQANKVLGGITRAGQEDDQGNNVIKLDISWGSLQEDTMNLHFPEMTDHQRSLCIQCTLMLKMLLFNQLHV